MLRQPDRLYTLLPAAFRLRDAAQGEPLRALLQVVEEQIERLEDDLQRQYDDWFIETCSPWAVPYIGDLLGLTPGDTVEPGTDAAETAARSAAMLPRREVANTLRWRRRKGTLALLQRLAQDVGGWPARAVEFRTLLAQTASLRGALPAPSAVSTAGPSASSSGRSAATAGAAAWRVARGRLADLRDGAALANLTVPPSAAFNTLAHSMDVRRLASSRVPGRFAPASVGVFVWRLKACPVSRAPAACREDIGPNCYTFSALGNDVQLYNRPRQRAHDDTIADAANLPVAIDRRAFAAARQPGATWALASPDFVGLAMLGDGETVAQSLAIWAPGWPPEQLPGPVAVPARSGTADAAALGDADDKPIPASRIIVADLSGWAYQPPRNFVAVDPVLGRIAFPPRQAPKRQVAVSYHHGFPADLGGGEYTRPLRQHPDAEIVRVAGADALRDALQRWRADDSGADGTPRAPAGQPAHAVIELVDNGAYVLPVRVFLGAGHSLQLRAAQHRRPLIKLLDWQVDAPDNLVVDGEAGSRFTLDGVVVAGRGVQVQGGLASVTVRHSTLVPGWSLEPNCDPKRPAEPSIEVIDSGACIVIEHSIVGCVQVNNDEVATDPIVLRISDSIVDATGSDCDGPQCEAIGAAGSRLAFAEATIVRSTLIGRVMLHALRLGENSLFLGCITVARRQIGCLRFCWVRPGSRTPRRTSCQPDTAEATVARDAMARGAVAEEIAALQAQARQRVWPRLDSTRYGTATYCRLALDCAPDIVRGADDTSEMGVYHDLFQPQRAAHLAQRLDDYAPAAAEPGVLYAD